MPTYQYACTDCGDRLEVVQKFSDDSLTVCPACQGRLRKVYSAVGVVFKGSGFYRTDSRAASNGSSQASKASSGETSAGSSDSGSSDSGSSDGSSSDGGSSGVSKDGSSNGKADSSKAGSSSNAASSTS